MPSRQDAVRASWLVQYRAVGFTLQVAVAATEIGVLEAPARSSRRGLKPGLAGPGRRGEGDAPTRQNRASARPEGVRSGVPDWRLGKEATLPLRVETVEIFLAAPLLTLDARADFQAHRYETIFNKIWKD